MPVAHNWFIQGATYLEVLEALNSDTAKEITNKFGWPKNWKEMRAAPGAAFYTHGGDESTVVRVDGGNEGEIIKALQAYGLRVRYIPCSASSINPMKGALERPWS